MNERISISCSFEHAWEIHRTHHDRSRIEVVFKRPRPDLGELLALRKMWPDFATIAPAELKQHLGERGRVELGEFGSIDSHRLAARAASVGLAIESTDSSFVTESAYCRTCRIALVIDDESAKPEFIQRLISAGARIVEGYEC